MIYDMGHFERKFDDDGNLFVIVPGEPWKDIQNNVNSYEANKTLIAELVGVLDSLRNIADNLPIEQAYKIRSIIDRAKAKSTTTQGDE